MASFDAITALIPTLSGRIGAGASVEDLQEMVWGASDAEVVSIVQEAAELGRFVERIGLIGAGVIAVRSRREAGHAGLAQRRGHRSSIEFVQHLTGATKGEAARQVRVGEALVTPGVPDPASGSTGPRDEESPVPDPDAPVGSEGDPQPEPESGPEPGPGSESGFGFETDDARSQVPQPWHEPLGRALREGRVTSAQFDAIRRGLGEPPEGSVQAWSVAAVQLIDEATRRTVEELLAHARCVRDVLDPDGAAERFRARYERRSFRTWLAEDGTRRGSFAFDDEGAAFVDAVFAAALRPRRGGPRFVDPTEKSAAEDLVADTRTNDQLAYDLLMDLVRAGVLADPASVFGTRQAGLRLVQTIGADGAFGKVAVTEDGLTAVPAAVAERRFCEAGSVTVTVDSCGNPLDVGREQRLFTSKQRIALAIRDGGCRWVGCDRPASYCEAHHIDPYASGGRTDIDRGILLCRFHHMELHHGGWSITRDEKNDFVLRDKHENTIVLTRRLPLRYLWGDIDPPPLRFRPAA
ncbi:DUF222 domain-containing protein [Microbacterium panaciterrae]|uniref:HNH nuclease domain-containing protein n=1 Tax=Microbacterium panaciterrae TaxID=985759 RepID=A0ABP8PI21_9MICO